MTLWPAIIAGTVGLVSATLSFALARISLNRSHEENREQRAHSEFLLLIVRRIDAIEKLWVELYEIEKGVELGDVRIKEIIAALMWLPAELRDKFTKILVVNLRKGSNFDISTSGFLDLREGLLQAARVAEADKGLLARKARGVSE
ncbi:hypothetical protein ACFVYT_09410 [Streptomyces sp. NPDC058290]|uniref:hypothetical protein n=1 Tax=Streptomyces sp. NPDC058290 TaxID=3346426 RepID=UPI0036EC495C